MTELLVINKSYDDSITQYRIYNQLL